MSGNKHIKHGNRYTSRNKVELIRAGNPYFDRLLKLIASAREYIHLQTYIYEDDETGRLVAEALKEAVKRNVEVYLLADGYASKGMSQSFINDLKKGGIQFRYFNPLFKSRNFYFGRRLHHKVFVVDSKYAVVGGINIANRYNDMPGIPAWLDFALYIDGEAAGELCILCWKTWNNFPVGLGLTSCDQKKIAHNMQTSDHCDVGMRRNDWVRRKNQISSTYVEMFRHAKSHVTILCSYFLPGRVIRRQMSYAASRGVVIKVITASSSDVKLAKYAERYLYAWLLRNNIELYEYQPEILHGKIAVCDGEWMTIGSYNINDVSTYASIELNMNVRNEAFGKKTEQVLQQIIDRDCVRITKEYHRKTGSIFNQLARWFSYQFFRLAFYIFTFYFKHQV